MITPVSLDPARPIGVFDSGIGGLTVAAALRRRLPHESQVYLGDIARLPYGTKAPGTVVRYALQAARHLVDEGVKMLVVACNTASAHALGPLADAFPWLPVVGVIEPGAEAAATRSASGRIAVAATEGTCASGAFPLAIHALRPDAQVRQVACPLFVALAEEGLAEGPIAEDMARSYLGALFSGPDACDCLVLGCTHFPLLTPALRRVLGDGPVMIDCADQVAEAVALRLNQAGLAAPPAAQAGIRLITTDAPDRFARVASRFFPELGQHPAVELIDL